MSWRRDAADARDGMTPREDARMRAFGDEISNASPVAPMRARGIEVTPKMGAMSPRAGGVENAGAGARAMDALTPRAAAMLRDQRSLASPLRAAISPTRPASGVRSSVKQSESATKRDVARLRELNSMLLKQLSSARTACAEAESARETLGEAMEREMARSKSLAKEVEDKAAELRAAAKEAKANKAASAEDEATLLRELNAKLVKEVSIARNVVKAREREWELLRDAAGKSDERAATLAAEIEQKQKSLERVQAALASATERAADSLRANMKVEKLSETNAVLMGELAALRESASSDAQALRAQIAVKSSALSEAQADLAAAEEELRALNGTKADVDRLRSLNSTLMQQIKSLRVKADEALNVSLSLEGKERELVKVQTELKTAEDAKVVAEDDVNKLRQLNVVLMQQISALTDDAKTSAQELQAKQSELTAAQLALELVEEENERAHGEVSKLRELNIVIMAQIKL